jgi:hypothetical protein
MNIYINCIIWLFFSHNFYSFKSNELNITYKKQLYIKKYDKYINNSLHLFDNNSKEESGEESGEQSNEESNEESDNGCNKNNKNSK